MNAPDPAAVRARAVEYLTANGTLAEAAVVRRRVQQAFENLERFLRGADPAHVRRSPAGGGWSLQEIADHVLQTHRACLAELRQLLAGRRPEGDPVPAGLQSATPLARPWAELLDDLATVHREIVAALAGSPVGDASVRAPVVLVVNAPAAGGGVAPVEWIEELDWKAYAVVLRLHAVDHLQQARAAATSPAAPAS